MLAETAQFEPAVSPPLSSASIRIGAVSVSIHGLSPEDCQLDAGLALFRFDAPQPDITIEVEWADKLRRRSSPVFDSGALWSLFRDERGFTFDFFSPRVSESPYKQLCVDGEFRSARLVLSREALIAHRPISPLEYPADELLITNYLAHGALGVEVHGCGLVDAEAGGYLFLGHSGAGKSTTTRLWQSARNPEILSDDRIVLRFHQGALWMYGTPWHGEGRFASPGRSRIDRIFILQHCQQNQITRMPPSQAAGELFARCFPPFHSPSGLQGTIDFLDDVVNAVACYKFGFVPDIRAVEAVIEMTHANALW
jgi:hypothetical protein